jgi:mono/diheme cytochrome c family protein
MATRVRIITGAIACIAGAVVLASAAAADPRQGKVLAQRRCANCHVVASGQANGYAMPFPTVARQQGFGAEKLAFFLLEPHPKTPGMGLGRREVTDLADYIATLAKK